MGSQGKIEWPLLNDDCERSELLMNLGRELKALAFDKSGLSFLSRGVLKRLIDVASWHILIHLPSRDHMLHFTRRLASSPLSFCFLDKESLGHFIRVVKRIRQLVKNQDLEFNSIWDEIQSNVSSCKMTEMDSVHFKTELLTPFYSHFFVKPANGHYESLLSWILGEPSDIPCSGPLQLPLRPPSFLTHIDVLSGACQQLMETMAESISCFNENEVHSVVPKTTYYSNVSNWLHEYLVEKVSSNVGEEFLDCFSNSMLENMRIDYLTQTHSCGLRLVELLCVLESWEFKVRRLCSFNFCSFMVPLMQRYFQHLLRDTHYGDNRNRDTIVAGYTNVSAFEDVKKEYNSKSLASMAVSRTRDAYNSGIVFGVAEGDLMRVIHVCETEDLVGDAISHIRFHKTWKYWHCHMCRARYADSESHMNHMDEFHELSLPSVEQCGLIPRAPSKNEIDRLLGSEWMHSPLKTLLHNEGDLMENRGILTKMKELLYSIIDQKPVRFSASSHLLHLVEFARIEFFRDMWSNKKNLTIGKGIDQFSQIVFSMLSTPSLQRVLEFLENLCKQCILPQSQCRESNEIPNVVSCGIFYDDHTLQVDPTKFKVAFSQAKEAMIKEKSLPFISKHEIMSEIYEQLNRQLVVLKWNLNAKSEVLMKLDVVFALDRILIAESDQARFLRSRYEKLDFMDPTAQSTFQHHLISQILNETSSCSIEEVLEHEKDELLYQLDHLDVQIMQELAEIDKLKRGISELCCCDYSINLLPYVGVFLNPRIRLDGDLGSWASNKLQELLFSIDHFDLPNGPTTFRIISVTIGKVLVNIAESKWGLGFEYRGMKLDFEGEWPFLLQGEIANGYINFAGLSDWHTCRNEHIEAKSEVVASIAGIEYKKLSASLKEAVCAKLLKFQYEFVERSTPDIPPGWYEGDVPLPFPNEPRYGVDPLKSMKSDCLKNVTSEFRQLSRWKTSQRFEEDDW